MSEPFQQLRTSYEATLDEFAWQLEEQNRMDAERRHQARSAKEAGSGESDS